MTQVIVKIDTKAPRVVNKWISHFSWEERIFSEVIWSAKTMEGSVRVRTQTEHRSEEIVNP